MLYACLNLYSRHCLLNRGLSLLKKLFIKDYKNVSDPGVRIRYGVVAGAFGIATNVVLFLIKLLIGLLANSITIIADAINNLSDAGSSIFTMVGFKLSNRPADKDHPYGHARYEQITALLVAILVLCIGILFAKSSVDKIISPQELNISLATFVILIIAVALKLIQMLTYLDFAKAISSEAIKAAAMDSRNDIITTVSVLVSMVVMRIFEINIDGWVGLAVSIFVIFSAIGMIREVISGLLGTPPTQEQVDGIYHLFDGHDEIIGHHDLIIHSYGAGTTFASLHAEFDSAGNITHIHDIIDNIEREASSKLGIALTIHMDPVDVSNPRRHKLYELALEAVKKYNPEIMIHDFRLVEGPTHTNVLFDIVEPFGESYDIDRIKEILSEAFSKEEGTYYFVINVDKKMD